MADEVKEGSQFSKIHLTRRGALELGAKAAVATSVASALERYKFMYPQKAEAQSVRANFPLETGTGWFYTETRGDETDPQLGYKVESSMWTEFQKYRGVNAWGFPETRPFRDDIGRLCQGFQKGIFQLTEGRDGRVGNVEWANLFDRLSEMGEDDWLDQQLIPKPFAFDDSGKNDIEIEQSRLALLEPYPQLKEAFFRSAKEFQNPDLWQQQYGYPVAVKEYPEVVTIRTQRAAIHLWKKNTAWARAGGITFANGVELLKKRTPLALKFMPIEALLLELPDKAKAERARELEKTSYEKYGARRLPENIEGSPLFVQEVRRTLTLIEDKTPDMYRDFIRNVYYIHEASDSKEGMGVGVWYRGVRGWKIQAPLSTDSLFDFASRLIHEAHHVKLYAQGLQPGNKYGETAAELARLTFGERIGSQRVVQDATNTIARIDTPSGQWWRQSA